MALKSPINNSLAGQYGVIFSRMVYKVEEEKGGGDVYTYYNIPDTPDSEHYQYIFTLGVSVNMFHHT